MSASGGARFDDRFSERIGDGAGDPGLYDAVHADPIGRAEGSHVGEDVALQGVPANDEEDGFAPAAVEGRGNVEHKWNKQPDVLHGHSLGMQVDEGCGLVLKESSAKMRIAVGGGEILGILGVAGGSAVF
jgi:hypothetical protein